MQDPILSCSAVSHAAPMLVQLLQSSLCIASDTSNSPSWFPSLFASKCYPHCYTYHQIPLSSLRENAQLPEPNKDLSSFLLRIWWLTSVKWHMYFISRIQEQNEVTWEKYRPAQSSQRRLFSLLLQIQGMEDASKCVTTWAAGEALICSICTFPWCNYSQHEWFWATNVMWNCGAGKRCAAIHHDMFPHRIQVESQDHRYRKR